MNTLQNYIFESLNNDEKKFIKYIGDAIAYPGSQTIITKVMSSALAWQQDDKGCDTLEEYYKKFYKK